ncbi:hypothetical protein IWX49DRAFT_251083 [Phyllosticta citricarpa]|uniref:Uncharacterized protein n=2 Tax=Phyllosticta TaxID=121621 RepID=A0ABR1MFE5_9PEZI
MMREWIGRDCAGGGGGGGGRGRRAVRVGGFEAQRPDSAGWWELRTTTDGRERIEGRGIHQSRKRARRERERERGKHHHHATVDSQPLALDSRDDRRRQPPALVANLSRFSSTSSSSGASMSISSVLLVLLPLLLLLLLLLLPVNTTARHRALLLLCRSRCRPARPRRHFAAQTRHAPLLIRCLCRLLLSSISRYTKAMTKARHPLLSKQGFTTDATGLDSAQDQTAPAATTCCICLFHAKTPTTTLPSHHDLMPPAAALLECTSGVRNHRRPRS